ncbi:hypothetical protein RRF57_006982 [Xylaria bambusicola]|uniref:DUF7600 domain-containing protein n=1 Tax=Xylaria bambusicola TaxID=326684 RepID=A0AAN7Z9X6_9PEZI
MMSFPTSRGVTLDFGHDYGGLYQRRNPTRWPLCPGEETRLSILRTTLRSSEFDPWDISFITRAVDDEKPYDESFKSPTAVRKTTTTNDCFGKLPIEIMDLILQVIPSIDVLSLKLGSHVIANTPLSDRFWHSRFTHGREFDYVFEFSQYSKYRGQWKRIFLSTRRLQHQPSLVNRKRIWGLTTALHKIMTQMRPCHGSAIRSWFEPEAPPDSRAWITASRTLRPAQWLFSEGSRSLYERVLILPEILSAISFSVTDLFTGRYISGLQIRDTNGNHRDIGFFQPHTSVMLTTTHIRGFIIAEDQRGIRGIRVLSGSGPPSEWVGQYQNIPQRRLVLPKTSWKGETVIKILKGGFDACKMVFLAISSHSGSADYSDDSNQNLCLQDTAIWYPKIPYSGLSFFGVSNQSRSDPERICPPLRMALFSDLSNSHLQHVIGIRFWTYGNGAFRSLRIDLDKPLHGQTHVYFGAKESDMELIQLNDEFEEYGFTISSADGEKIIGLDVNYFRNQTLLGFELHTSFDRTAQLPPAHKGVIPPNDLTSNSSIGLTDLGIVCDGNVTLMQFPPIKADGRAWN